MNSTHVLKVAAELHLRSTQVQATAALLGEGATVPFIARYRKEATGMLDEVAITSIRDLVHCARTLRNALRSSGRPTVGTTTLIEGAVTSWGLTSSLNLIPSLDVAESRI